jgi:hypothetical protein
VLYLIGNDAQRQRLDRRNRSVSILHVGHRARKRWYLGKPAPVIFTLDFD